MPIYPIFVTTAVQFLFIFCWIIDPCRTGMILIQKKNFYRLVEILRQLKR